MSKPNLDRITWRQPAVFTVATLVCTVLSIWAVVAAPVDSSAGAVTGIFGLLHAGGLRAFGTLVFAYGAPPRWLSKFAFSWVSGLMLPLPFVLVWALADFFEGFVPLRSIGHSKQSLQV